MGTNQRTRALSVAYLSLPTQVVQGSPADTEEVKPFVHYQEKMTKTMKDLSRKGQDMVSVQELFRKPSVLTSAVGTRLLPLIFCLNRV